MFDYMLAEVLILPELRNHKALLQAKFKPYLKHINYGNPLISAQCTLTVIIFIAPTLRYESLNLMDCALKQEIIDSTVQTFDLRPIYPHNKKLDCTIRGIFPYFNAHTP